jgi:hypothetical protein
MTSLLDAATNNANRAQQEQTDAQTALANAQTDLANAQKQRDAAAVQIAKLNGDIAATRVELANAAMPADAEAAAQTLATQLVELWDDQASSVALQTQIATLQGQIDADVEMLGAATARLAGATTAKDSATKTDKEHTAWHDAAGAPPLDGVVAAATAVVGSQLYTHARARAQGAGSGFHPDMLDHVKKRRQNALDRIALAQSTLDGLEADLDDWQAEHGGDAGALAPLQSAYTKAEARFRDAVKLSLSRLDRAQGLLAMIVGQPALSTADKNAMLDNGIVGAATPDPRKHQEDQAAEQLAVDQAQANVDRKQRRSDLGLADLPQLANAEQDLTDAQNALNALDPFSNSNQQALAAWSHTVPDLSWQLLAAFLEADDILTALQALDLGALENAMAQADTALGNALDPADKTAGKGRALATQVTLQSKTVEVARGNQSATVLSALRGDG